MTKKRPPCRATTKAGKPCRNQAMPGAHLCGAHGGAGKVGRPELIENPDIRQKILDAYEYGASYEVAAHHAGIHPDTFQAWRKKGRTDLETGDTNTTYAQLVTDLQRARAKSEITLVKRIRALGRDDWRANAFVLERRFPERWARRDHVDVSVSERSKPQQVTPEGERRDEIMAVLASALAPPAGGDE